MQIQNIHSIGNKIYLFKREDTGMVIREDDSFFPYFYEPDVKGTVPTYDNKLARKVVLNNPKDVAKTRSAVSYESDVLYVKRYLIDKVPTITPSLTKYIFLDIEILTKEFPDVTKANRPVSCITTFVSSRREYCSWYLGEWGGIPGEIEMLEDCIQFITNEQPDILCAWNVDFDYQYLYNRLKTLKFHSMLPTLISPISACRPGKKEVLYPAGVSIVDYMGLYQKLTLSKRRSYALDYICQEDLGEDPWPETGFDVLDDTVKAKNLNDVRRMVALEDKYKVITHFDGVRRFTKCLWEDLAGERKLIEGKVEYVSNNSKPLDMVFLQEAHDLGIVLPRKPEDTEKLEFEGAFRESYVQGVFHKVGKYDLSGAYLYAAIDMCLDAGNIVDEAEYKRSKDVIAIDVSDRKTRTVKEIHYVRQNADALVPRVLDKLVTEKNKLKELHTQNKNDEIIEQEYKSKKGLVLSAWGVLANRYFRLYDNRVASMITSIVRDLVHYVNDEVEKLGYKVIYVDTDSAFCVDNGVNISPVLNDLVRKWSLSRFGKVSQITFDYEGHFSKLLMSSKCHYYGYLEGRTKPEIKGVKIKRADSSKYEAEFQRALFERVLAGDTKEKIITWTRSEMDRIKTLPVKEIAFPVKLQSDYENSNPIHNRAADNSKEMFNDFKLHKGDLFYYTFIEPIGTDADGKARDVLAFKADYDTFQSKRYNIKVDWQRVIERNIINKVDTVFEIMNWGDTHTALQGQLALW